MLGWLKHLYSDSLDASYGRVLSTAAFITMVLLHVLIMINPYGIFKQLLYVPQLTTYLFYLAAGSYTVTSIKEAIRNVNSYLHKDDNGHDLPQLPTQ
jgi:hypothetical protein